MNHLIGKSKDGRDFLALVLEPGNIQLIREGKPILKHIDEFFEGGIPRKLDLLIFHSETPVADAKEFAKVANMSFDERTPRAQQTRPHCPECKTTVEQLGVWRNESPMAITFCVGCGCVFGMVPSEIAKGLK